MSEIFLYNDADIRMHHRRDMHPHPDDFPIHAHGTHEMLYFIAGRGEYYVEGTAYRLIPGSLLLMRTGETHYLKISPDYPYERIAIHFSQQILTAVDSQGILSAMLFDRPLGQRNQYRPEQLHTELVQSCLSAITGDPAVAGYSQERQRLLIISNLYPILCDARRCFDQPVIKEDTPLGAIHQVIAYINCHLSEELNLDTLAEIAAVSKSYLNRQFRQVTGTTLWEYTILKRLMLARQYIREKIPAGEVALLCGWSDYSSFYRQYKAHFGISPQKDKPDEG